MKRWLVALLIRLTDRADVGLPNQGTEDLLAELWLNDNFKRYLGAREKKLREYLSSGIGANPLTRGQYVLAFGQLQEVVNLTVYCKNAYESKAQRLKQQKKFSTA